jgi:cytochrome c5
MMTKKLFINVLIVTLVLLVSKAYAGKEKKLSNQDLFKNKCTQCHEAERAKIMHASKETFLEIIKKMMKKGAKATDDEAKSIAEFLGSPSRFLFEEKCTKCHGLARVIETHKKGNLNKDTIKKMKKKGADISEKDIESIYDYLNYYYFVAPEIPGGPGIR